MSLRQRPLRARGDLGCITEQAVAVERRAGDFRRARGHRQRDDAVEVRLPGPVLNRVSFGVEVHPTARPAVREQEAGNREVPLHPAGDLARVRFVLDARHFERRRGALDDPVGQVGVTELGERVVAHGEHAAGVVFVACDREVPGQVQARTFDASGCKRREQFVEVRAPRVDGFFFGGQFVAEVTESRRRFKRFVLVFEIAQRDDVAVPGGEVHGRVDLEVCLRGSGARVDLDPDRPAFAGRRVDHHDRRIGLCVARKMVDRDGFHRLDIFDRVDPLNRHEDRRAWAESVGGVVRIRFDVRAFHVGRRGGGLEGDAAPRGARWVGDRVVVVGEGQHADGVAGVVDELAAFAFSDIERRKRLADRVVPA